MPEIPPDLAGALRGAGLAAFFRGCTPAHRNEYLKWIGDAKRPETRSNRIGRVLRALSDKRTKDEGAPAAPGVAGYSGTPLWKKLGYKAGTAALVVGAPGNYTSLLTLPAEVKVEWLPGPRRGMGFVHLFAKSAAELQRSLISHRGAVAADGVIWVSWPKKSSGVATDVTEDVIRRLALSIGLVDIKVCAVDEVWSGLKLMIRKELR
jgi:Bacteriocin-protection, YdeI or OmpD-Associated